jgi:hypothetical protein
MHQFINASTFSLRACGALGKDSVTVMIHAMIAVPGVDLLTMPTAGFQMYGQFFVV